MPGFMAQASGFVKSAGKVLRSGLKMVSEDEFERRIQICRSCDLSIKREGDTRCSLCGCNMEVKCQYAAVACDDGRWNKV